MIFVQIIAVTMMAGGFVSVVQSYLPARLPAEKLSVLLSSEIISVTMLVGTAGTILGGIISDRFGTRSFLLSTSISFWLAAWIVIFCTENQGLLYFAAVLMGFASPLCSVTSSLLMSSTFGPKAYTELLGIAQASAFLSIGILFPIAGMMYRMQGTYRWIFILINVLMIVMVIVAFAGFYCLS